MKSVLFIIPSLTSGGAERQAVTIACLLKRRGYNVSFWCYGKGSFYQDILSQENIPVCFQESNYLRRILYAVRYIKKGHYDAVVSFMDTPDLLNNIAAVFGKKWKVIGSQRSIMTERDFKTKRNRIMTWFYRFSDFIVCNSDRARISFAENLPKYKTKLLTIYNTVSLAQSNFDYICRKNERLNIVIAATVYNAKNPLGLLRALSNMNERERASFHIDWYGRKEAMEGDHTEYDKAIEYTKENGLSDVISFNPPSLNIAEIMYKSDCVALFSIFEGLPNAICEGMLLGKPIIMTKVSDYQKLVENEVNGFLCDWNDSDSIRNAILRMSSKSKNELISMGGKSQKKAEALFGEESVISKWIELIEK